MQTNTRRNTMSVEMRELDPEEIDQPEPQELQLAEPVSVEAQHLMTLPIGQLESQIRENSTTLGSLSDQLSDARRIYVLRTHPSRHLSTEAREVALRDHLPALQAVECQVEQAAAHLRESAQVIVGATSQDREPTLSDADMNRAAAAREFVKENCETLTIQELRSKVHHALQTNDAAQAWLYLRYGMQRLGDNREADRRTPQDIVNLQTLLASVRDRMSDKRCKETNVRARELRLAAAQLEGRAKAQIAATHQTDADNKLRSMF
jgi:hypothetical protein